MRRAIVLRAIAHREPRPPAVRAVFFGRIALIAALSIGASVARTVLGGQDFNFDLVTYHYYLGYSAFAERLSLDFLPASFQGYQTPWPYVLLYLLDSSGVPPIVNASLHASIHALNLILLFLLTESLVGAIRTARDRVMVVALWLLGAVAPIYWYLVGTSFADLMTSFPVLAGLYLVARALRTRCGTVVATPACAARSGSDCAGSWSLSV